MSSSQLKLLWIREMPWGGCESVPPSEAGGGLEMHLLREMRRHQVIAMKELLNAFPTASAYFREHGSLRMMVEEAPQQKHWNVQLSRWENVISSKKFAAVLTIARCPPAFAALQHSLPASSSSSSSLPPLAPAGPVPYTLAKHINNIKAMLQDGFIRTSLRRCVVFDAPEELVRSLEGDTFINQASRCGQRRERFRYYVLERYLE
ncbi:Hypothetical protein, putative [Bodo saltans]|uniref:Uncharacterized protein n=1 Tax=Bodo saltans TaxID=75058 RepID=A0A0S4JEV5_BODSA|nr:Hypothetical protein, putative [Bodo saltans]|eukprot:CUG88988.1 Hypothetical protein, putative [Bodo saltans]